MPKHRATKIVFNFKNAKTYAAKKVYLCCRKFIAREHESNPKSKLFCSLSGNQI